MTDYEELKLLMEGNYDFQGALKAMIKKKNLKNENFINFFRSNMVKEVIKQGGINK